MSVDRLRPAAAVMAACLRFCLPALLAGAGLLAGEGAGLDPRGETHMPIGIPDSLDTLKTFVEAEGCFSPGFGTYGVYFWLFDPESKKLLAPTSKEIRAEHGLRPGGLPIPWTSWKAGDFSVTTELCQVAIPSPRGEIQVVAARARVASSAPRSRKAQLYAALRPLGPAGGPVGRIDVDADGFALLVDGHAAIIGSRRPDDAGAAAGDSIGSAAAAGALPESRSAVSPSGKASGALRFDLEIPPGETRGAAILCPVLAGRNAARHRWDGSDERTRRDVSPLFPADEGEPQPEPEAGFYRSLDADRLFAEAEAFWKNFHGDLAIRLPDPRWTDAFHAIAAHIALCLDDGAPDGAVMHAGASIRDGALAANVLLKAGRADLSARAIDHFLAHPFSDRTHPEPDSPGRILWALGEHWKFTRDLNWLGRIYPASQQAARLIRYIRTAPGPHRVSPDGLEVGDALPEEKRRELRRGGGDGNQPDDSGAFDVAGVRAAALLAEAMQHDAQAAEWYKLAIPLFKTYDRELGDRLGKEPAAGSVLWPCRVYPLEAGKAVEAFRGAGARRPDGGLRWLQLAAAHQALLAGSRDAGGGTIEAHLGLPQMTGWYALDEGVDSSPGGWHQARTRWPSKVAMPHARSVAEFVLLLRDCMVFEDGDRLVLLAGIPDGWLRGGPGLSVENLPTHHGRLSFQLMFSAEGAALTFTGQALPPDGFALRWPWDLQGAFLVDGKPAARNAAGDVMLPAGAGTVRFLK